MLQHTPSLEAFDGSPVHDVPGAFLYSGHLACSSPDGGYGVHDTDFVDPSDLFDGGAPANDAERVADSIRSIYHDAEWPIPDEVA